MKKKILLLFVSLFVALGASSQLLFTNNLYFENHYAINPAYAGLNKQPVLFLSYRRVASSINGAPEHISVGISSGIFKNMGLGARFFNQSEGLFNTIVGFADYSYKVDLNNFHILRFGLSAGFNSNKIDYSNMVATDLSEITEVISDKYEGIYFEAAAGLSYSWDKMEVSVAVPKLFQAKGDFIFPVSSMLQYRFDTKYGITLKPSAQVTYVPSSPYSYDVNLTANWKERFWVGAGYRNRPALVFSAGIKLNNLVLTYASEIGMEKYSNMFNQVHQVGVSYTFSGKGKKLPEDEIDPPINNLVVENKIAKDSLPIDSVQNNQKVVFEDVEDADTTFVDPEIAKNTETKTSKEPKFKISVAGNGVFDIQPVFSDTIAEVHDSIFNNDYLLASLDSMIEKSLDEQIEQENKERQPKLYQTGSGVYTLKKYGADTSTFDMELEMEILDSLIKNTGIIEKAGMEKHANYSEPYYHAEYYTVRLFFDRTGQYSLLSGEMEGNVRLEYSNKGGKKYYYGYYSSMVEAEKKQSYISQKFGLKTQVLKFDEYR